MKTIILTFVYPSAMEYFAQFLDSINQQSNKDFKLYIVNDHVEKLEEFITCQKLDLITKMLPITTTISPAEIRTIGLQWAINDGTDYIIFADSDDYFNTNRVEVSVNLLDSQDIVFNDLVAVGKEITPISLLSNRFTEGEIITLDSVLNLNCLGLSNTAIRTKMLFSIIDRISRNVIAYDWHLFSLLLQQGLTAYFTKKTCTYYRQHGNNIASLSNFNDHSILTGIRVKMLHYEANANHGSFYQKKATQYRNLHNQLEQDDSLRYNYCESVRRATAMSPCLWWEHIKTLEEL